MSPFGFDTTSEEVVQAFAGNIKGRVFLVTGASAGGLGASTAVHLARQGPAQLILVSRNRAKVEPVLQEVAAIDKPVRTTFVPCELSDPDSVRAAAAQINGDAAVPRVDVVVNNAGVMAIPEYTLDKQGVEMTFSANHVGHFLLTNLLMPKIAAAGHGARIVNVTSRGHEVDHVHLDDHNFSGGRTYDPWSGYGRSKTANILFSLELNRRLRARGITSLAVHPGVIFETSLANHVNRNDFSKIPEIAKRNTGRDMGAVGAARKTLSQGSSSILCAALNPEMDAESGVYVADCQITPPADHARDPEAAKGLWELSEKLVGQKFDL